VQIVFRIARQDFAKEKINLGKKFVRQLPSSDLADHA
jgi:hypothetical protein